MSPNNIDTYNVETEHDMRVDFGNYEHTGTPPMFSPEPDRDNIITNLNDLD